MGSLRVMDPQRLYDNVHLSEFDFRRTALFSAARDFHRNRRLINRKGSISNLVAVLFLADVLCLAVWVTRTF